MDTSAPLQIYERDTTLTPRKLRSIDYIPVTVYGKAFHPLSAQVKAHEFELPWFRGIHHYQITGCGQTALRVEAKQVQVQNTKDKVLHIEFYVPAPSDGTTSQKAVVKSDTVPVVSEADVAISLPREEAVSLS